MGGWEEDQTRPYDDDAAGAQVSMRMARGSWSSLSSHGKWLGPQEALKKDSRGLSRVEAKDSALLSSRDAGLLEPPERPQGSPASSSVWREPN